MRLIFMILTSMLLAGCYATQLLTNPGPRQLDDNRHTKVPETPKPPNCAEKLAANPFYSSALKILAAHLPIDPTHTTLAQIADNGMPTDKEVRALTVVHDDFLPCREQHIAWLQMQPYGNAYAQLLIEFYRAEDSIAADLIQRKTTWGEANKAGAALYAAYQTKQQAIADQIQREVSAQYEAAAAHREAQIAAQEQRAHEYSLQLYQHLHESALQQSLINSLNRPNTTNCSSFGNSTTCTRY